MSTGQRIDLISGKYQTDRLLGHGGMAEVYLARDTVLNRPVALKLIDARLVRDPSFVKRFEREARLLAKLDHDHIVRIYDIGQIDGRPFLAMQYLEGETLAHAIRQRGRWKPAEVVRILSEIGSALDYAHAQGLLHRDVKPANIMLSRSGRATLMDFGIAKPSKGDDSTDYTEYTVQSELIGTPAYMSPEQIQGVPIGPASDLYSLGVVAYEMIAARSPFEAESTLAMIHKVVYEPPLPLDGLDPAIPAAVKDVVFAALNKQPELRYASAREFAAAFETAVRSGSAPEPARVRAAQEATARRRGLYSVVATAQTPALVIYLLDLSGSMSLPFAGRPRIEVVKEALQATLRQMVYRSTRGSRVSPRYRVAVLGYSDRVYDVLGGVKAVDEVARQVFNPELALHSTTNTARAFEAAEAILHAELPRLQTSPAPIVCHLTDGEYTGADPEPVVERIRALCVADGAVLVENIFVSDQIVSAPVDNARAWTGISPSTRLVSDYASKLRRMSSAIPESYRRSLAESGYHLDREALMLLPATSPDLVKLAFQVSGATGATPAL